MSSYVVFVLFVTLLTNAFGWAFFGEAFAHELGHHQKNSVLQIDLHQHHELGEDLDSTIHLCLHTAGQYQPFFFTFAPSMPAFVGREVLAIYIPIAIPESILDLPLHPPRNMVSG